MNPITAKSSVVAGNALQKAKIHQNLPHGHDSKMKKDRLIAAEQCANIAETVRLRKTDLT